MNATRVLWDDVPAGIKEELAGRRDVKQGAVAIVDREEGGRKERWYFRRVPSGWNNTAVDRDSNAAEAASDLTPQQREAALKNVKRVEEAMRITGLDPARPGSDQTVIDVIDRNKDLVKEALGIDRKHDDDQCKYPGAEAAGTRKMLSHLPCPASTGPHSFNMDEWIPDENGVPRKWGRCTCGALAPIPPPPTSMEEAKRVQDQLAKALARGFGVPGGIQKAVQQAAADELLQRIKDQVPMGDPIQPGRQRRKGIFTDLDAQEHLQAKGDPSWAGGYKPGDRVEVDGFDGGKKVGTVTSVDQAKGQVDVTLDLRGSPYTRFNLNSHVERAPAFLGGVGRLGPIISREDTLELVVGELDLQGLVPGVMPLPGRQLTVLLPGIRFRGYVTEVTRRVDPVDYEVTLVGEAEHIA